jgi:hypothetical protein
MENNKLDIGFILMTARWVGLLLIVLGWLQLIPLLLGWIGFGLAGISFILESISQKNLAHPKTGGKSGEKTSPDNKDKNNS